MSEDNPGIPGGQENSEARAGRPPRIYPPERVPVLSIRKVIDMLRPIAPLLRSRSVAFAVLATALKQSPTSGTVSALINAMIGYGLAEATEGVRQFKLTERGLILLVAPESDQRWKTAAFDACMQHALLARIMEDYDDTQTALAETDLKIGGFSDSMARAIARAAKANRQLKREVYEG